MGSSFRLILESALRLFTPWLVMVIAVTWAGFPGVVCITPLAWLLALAVGVRIEAHSPSLEKRPRLRQAALAGGFLGLLQGLLFILILPRLGPLQADERSMAAGIAIFFLISGILVAAGLSTFTAWLAQRRAAQLSK